MRVKNTAKILRETGLSFLPSQTAEREKKKEASGSIIYMCSGLAIIFVLRLFF